MIPAAALEHPAPVTVSVAGTLPCDWAWADCPVDETEHVHRITPAGLTCCHCLNQAEVEACP